MTGNKTYIVYCHFIGQPSFEKEPIHVHFEYLISANSADEAEALCKKRLAQPQPAEIELLGNGVEIYVDHIIEIGEVPAQGVILHFARYRGEYSAIHSALPLGDGGGKLEAFTTDDPEREAAAMVPFVVTGETPINC